MFRNIGLTEIIIIALVILMLFGARKLPEFARGLVEAKKEFKEGFEKEDKDEEPKKQK